MNAFRLLFCDATVTDLVAAIGAVQYTYKEPNLWHLFTQWDRQNLWEDYLTAVANYTYL